MAAFTTAAAGLWSNPATWTTAIPSGGPGLNVGDNDTVTINHDVTHDRAGITWLGTGSGTAVQINGGGALRMSRSASGTLRCWGNVVVVTLGTIDFGTIASPIPAGVNAFLEFRSANNFGLNCQDNSESYFVGTPTRKRWTRLIATPVLNVIRVADATGWQVDDYAFICASAFAFNSPYLGRITGVVQLGAADWEVTFASSVNTTYSINKPVGNLGANVGIYGVQPSAPYGIDLQFSNAATAGHSGLSFINTGTIRPGTRVLRSCRIGCGGVGGARQAAINNRVLGSAAWSENRDLAISSRGGTQFRFDAQIGTFRIIGAALDTTMFESNAQLFQGVIAGWAVEDFAQSYASIGNGNGSMSGVVFRNGHWGGAFGLQATNSGFWSDTLFEDVEFGALANVFGNQGAGTGAVFRRCLYGLPYSQDPVRGFMESTGFGGGALPTLNSSCSGVYTVTDSIFNASLDIDAFYGVGGSGGITSVVSPNTRVIVANKDGKPSLQTIYTPDGWFKNDTTTLRSPPYSLRWTPNTRGRPQALSFSVLAPNGAQVPVSGFLRRDAAYRSAGGTVVATLSGPGITAVSYISSGAADTWEQFAFNVIQTTGAPAVLTLTLTFTGTAGNAWAEDIVAPSSQAVSTGEFGFWAAGQPLGAILSNFAPAADVWNIPRSNLSLSGSIGQFVAALDSFLPEPIWSAILGSMNTAGSVGQALQQILTDVDRDPADAPVQLREAIRVLLAVAAGDVTGGPDAPQFKSLRGDKVRVGGVADEDGNRTRATLDMT